MRRVDGASLAIFRIAYGTILAWEVIRFLKHGWITRYYVEPDFNFTYPGFSWVTPWSETGMYAHFGVLFAASVAMALGWRTRISTAVVFLSFTYIFLLEQGRYLNHFYLVSLLGLLLIFLPTGQVWSLDARRRARQRRSLPSTVSSGAVWMLRFTVGLPYFFGGIAKLNSDWLAGQPMRMWLSERAESSPVGAALDSVEAALVFSFGGLILDLVAVPLLLWRHTRVLFLFPVLFFHCVNSHLFGIGIFPWFMLLATVVFFPPDLVRWMVRKVWVEPSRTGVVMLLVAGGAGIIALICLGKGDVIPFIAAGFAASLGVADFARRRAGEDALPEDGLSKDGLSKDGLSKDGVAQEAATSRTPVWAVALATIWICFHVTYPLRHNLIDGNVNWTEEGHAFSWHMKLRDKSSVLRFEVTDLDARRTWTVKPRDEMPRWQYAKLSKRPDLIWQYAQHLAERERTEATKRELVVKAHCWIRLNGRKKQRFIDPKINLVGVPRPGWGVPWILPLTEELPPLE